MGAPRLTPGPGGPPLIQGAVLDERRVIDTPGGAVLHMLRADWKHFGRFGEVYFSEVEPGAVKAWKLHQRMTQHLCVPVGLARVVLFDDREGSPTRGEVNVYLLGRPNQHALLRIPPGVWYGFAVEGGPPALVCNCADMVHDPEESTRREPDDPAVPYRWG